MAYARGNLSGPLQLGHDKKLYYYTSTETIGTVVAAGYFTNSTDNLRFVTGDLLIVKDSTNAHVATAECVTVSTTGAGVRFFVLPGDGAFEISTGGALSIYGTSLLNAAGTTFTLGAPFRAGQSKKIVCLTTGAVVTTTASAIYTTGGGIVFRVAGGVDLVARSSTSWVPISSFYGNSTGLGTDVLTSN